jgi:hypothetical protein
MSFWQWFFIIWAAFTGSVSALMGLARTPPDEAFSGFSKWAQRAGIHRIPSWLRDRNADVVAHKWARLALAVLLVVGIGGASAFLFGPSRAPAPPKVTAAEPTALPAIPYADEEVHGWLRPAGDPTPPNGCDRLPPSGVSADAMLIGDNAVGKNGSGKFVALEIGTCEAVSMERTSEGVMVNAQVIDADDNKPIQIRNNAIVALNGETYSARQSRDSSSVTITDRHQNIIFYARFINPTTLRVRGTFGCGGRKPIPVFDNNPIPGVYMSNSCFVGARVGIHIN